MFSLLSISVSDSRPNKHNLDCSRGSGPEVISCYPGIVERADCPDLHPQMSEEGEIRGSNNIMSAGVRVLQCVLMN